MSHINLEKIGPAPEMRRVSFLNSFFAYSRPTLMVRTGRSNSAQTDAAKLARHSLQLDESISCVRVRKLAQICAYYLLDDRTKQKFEDGDAVLFKPENSHSFNSEIEENRLFFIEELKDNADYTETVLFPDVAVALDSFLSTDFRSESVIDIEVGRVHQAEEKINCTEELLECIQHVKETDMPLLLGHYPKNDWLRAPRLVVYRVDHWIVQPRGARDARNTD